MPESESYKKDTSLFTSEFGIQAVPDIDSLKEFIPEDELWPPGYSWEYHFAELSKIAYYAYYIKSGVYTTDVKPEEAFESLDEFIDCSQGAQAEVLKFGIEHFRCRKWRNSGSIFWCFNEPWPSVICSIVDWYLRPKKAYYAVRNAYSPVLVSLQHNKKEWKRGEKFKVGVWIVNDYLRAFEDCSLEIRIVDNKANLLEEESIGVKRIEEDSAKKVLNLDWTIPRKIQGTFKTLLTLRNSEALVIARNEYEFRIQGGRNE